MVVSCSYDDDIKVWKDEDDDWVCTDTLKSHTSSVWSISFSHDGHFMVSSSDDKTVIIWKIDSDGKYHQTATLSGYHQRSIYSVDVNHKNLIATGGGDDKICFFERDEENLDEELHWNLTTTMFKAHSSDVNCV